MRNSVVKSLSFVACLLAFAASEESHARLFPLEVRLGLDAGYNYLDFSEIHAFQPSRSTVGFGQHAITVGGEFHYYILSHMNNDAGRYEGDLALMGDISYSAVPLSSSTGGTTAQVLRYNLRLGFGVPFVTYPWSLSLMGGLYNTSMLVNTGAFGYTNLTGPEIYPVLHWFRYDEDKVLTVFSAFFKYSPITDGVSPLSTGNREIAIGLTARLPVGNRFDYLKPGFDKSLTIKLSFAELQHTFQIVRDVHVSSRSYTLTVGYEW